MGLKQDAFKMTMLFDFYGTLLTEKQQCYFDLYYNQDFSLGEIAEQEGISRQGVRHIIKKGEEQLDAFESRIGLARRHEELSALTEKLSSEAKALLSSEDENVRAAGERILAVAAEIDKK